LINVIDVRCPSCSTRLNRAEAASGSQEAPTPGDVSFCIVCGSWSVFGDDLSLRHPNSDEKEKISNDFECILVESSWRRPN
jgi:hypothetical protein